MKYKNIIIVASLIMFLSVGTLLVIGYLRKQTPKNDKSNKEIAKEENREATSTEENEVKKTYKQIIEELEEGIFFRAYPDNNPQNNISWYFSPYNDSSVRKLKFISSSESNGTNI